ncbi:unnamed protein product [Rhizophagus irregularis]|nr:unnamed protein product [Rhizophagus irregularis]
MINKITNTTLNAIYPDLIFLFDLLQPFASNIELVEKDDDVDYKKLLQATIVSPNTTRKDFPLIMKEKQEVMENIEKERIGLNTIIDMAISVLVNRRNEPNMNVGRYGFTKSYKSIIENPKGYTICANSITIDLMKKSNAWLKLYTRIGQEAMHFLLTNYSIFLSIQNGYYIQIMGPAISRKRPIEDLENSFKVIVLNDRKIVKANTNSVSNLFFSRSVMFFGSPVYNKSGDYWYGLPKNHILNVAKYSNHNVNMSHTVIKYIFPRQFGLTNAFTCRSSHELYYVYMDRRKELDNLRCKVPDYLNHLLPYIERVIKRHDICQYKHLLNTHCPIQENSLNGCNTYQVTKFVIGVLDFIFPPELFGDKDNKTVIYNMIRVFIEKRHFEEVSLHEVLQNFKIKKCQWLKGKKNLETSKCTEMLCELIWWIFECFVIPLLKLNFYITNHAKQGNQLFYYRQEIWSRMVKQNLITLTSSVYEKIPPENEIRIFKDKKLGYSKLKFILKDNKGNLRPIEKNPSLLTGSVFSYNEVHACLKEYKQHLANENNPQLYFAKVDIKCCFETIDQNILIEIIRKEVLTENKYSVNKYEATYLKGGTVCRKQDYYVHDSSEILSFLKYSAKLTQNYKNAILIDSAYRSYKEVDDVFKLLEEHIQQNIIKVDENYYQQKIGIPQGSILSSLLCSIYYGVMELEEFKYIIDDTNGCTVNDEKSVVNFDLTIKNNKINKIDDYDIANTLTIKLTKTPGIYLKQKIIEFLLAKNHKIFYDTSLNKRETTLLNIYQNFLMGAMKFHHCIKGMTRQKFQRNEDFEIETLYNAFDHLYSVLCKTDASNRYSFNISKKEFMWLGAFAFRHILNKKQSYHKGVLEHFKKFLENSRLDNLNHIVDCKLSLIFNKIIY